MATMIRQYKKKCYAWQDDELTLIEQLGPLSIWRVEGKNKIYITENLTPVWTIQIDEDTNKLTTGHFVGVR